MVSRRAPSARGARVRPPGQHFLRERHLAARLVRDAAISSHELVFEPGAGFGVITAELAARARGVIAVELDPRLARGLATRFGADPTVQIVHGDALEVPWPRQPWRAFGNIPFAITTKLLRALLDDDLLVRCDLLVQWEAALKRARSRPSTLLSLSWGPWWRFDIGAHIPARCFFPRPPVDAGMLSVKRRDPPLVDPRDRRSFVKFVRSLWAHRSGLLGPSLDSVTTHRRSRRASTALALPRNGRIGDLDAETIVALFRFVSSA